MMLPEARDPGALAALRVDLDTAARHCADVLGESGVRLRRRVGLVVAPCMLVAICYRLSHVLWQRGWRRSARVVAGLNRVVHHIDIHPACVLGPGLYIPHPAGTVIRAHAEGGLVVTTHVVLCGDAFSAPALWPRIGRDVAFAPFACIQGPLVVGARAKIGPRVVLAHSLAADHVALVATRTRPVSGGAR